MHNPTDTIAHIMAFGTPVVENWLEREIVQWVHQEGSIWQSITMCECCYQGVTSRSSHLNTKLYCILHVCEEWKLCGSPVELKIDTSLFLSTLCTTPWYGDISKSSGGLSHLVYCSTGELQITPKQARNNSISSYFSYPCQHHLCLWL